MGSVIRYAIKGPLLRPQINVCYVALQGQADDDRQTNP